MLLHAGGTTWRLWSPLLVRLTAERDVLAPTLPGHLGGPPLPNGNPLRIGDFADAVERGLDAVGFERPDIVGNSLGGFAALELARRGRARRIVAIAPAGMQSDAGAAATVRRILVRHRIARALRPAMPAAAAFPQARRLLLRDGAAHGERVPLPLARHLLDALTSFDAHGFFDATGQLKGNELRIERPEEITQPTLLIRGSHDAVISRGQIERYLRALPDARLVEIEDAGHCPQLDQPVRIAREILEFTEAS